METYNLENEVIINHSPEYGLKYIKPYWENKGVNTNRFTFSSNISNNNFFCYGVINGIFGCYNIEDAKDNNCKFTCLPLEEQETKEFTIEDITKLTGLKPE